MALNLVLHFRPGWRSVTLKFYELISASGNKGKLSGGPQGGAPTSINHIL